MSGRKRVVDKRANLIKGRLVYSGLSVADAARKIGLTTSTMYRRLKRPGLFTLCEIELLDELVGFSEEELLYFFRYRRTSNGN